MPAEVVLRLRMRRVASSVIVILAPATTAPLWSVTVPSILPMGACATAALTKTSANRQMHPHLPTLTLKDFDIQTPFALSHREVLPRSTERAGFAAPSRPKAPNCLSFDQYP